MEKEPYKTAKLPIFAVDMSRLETGNDTFIDNGVVEKVMDAFSGNGVSYVRQRPAFEVADLLTNKTGKYHHAYYPYYCLGTTVFKQEDGGSASTIYTGTNATNTVSKLTNIRDTQNKRDMVIFVEGSTGKMIAINKSTGATTDLTAAGAPATVNPHVATLDGYLFVILEGSDEIYNSDINDVTSWNLGTNFIRSLAAPGNLTCLTEYKNYVLAFKATSAEFFYNAGLTGTSPLQRNDSLRLSVGCEYPFTIAKGEDILMWVGRGIGGNTPSVYKMIGDNISKVSTPPIERQLESTFVSYDKEASFRGWLYKDSGHVFYILRAGSKYFCFDLETNEWSYWTYNAGTNLQIYDINDPPEENSLGPYFYWNDSAGNATYLGKFSDPTSQYDSYLGTSYPIIVKVLSPPVDLGTVRRKQLSLIRLIGSISGSGYNSRVRWSDNDGANWSNWHTLPLGPNPVLRNLGQTRRRMFEFEFVDVATNSPGTRLSTLPTKLRFEGFELEYREGIN